MSVKVGMSVMGLASHCSGWQAPRTASCTPSAHSSTSPRISLGVQSFSLTLASPGAKILGVDRGNFPASPKVQCSLFLCDLH